MSCRAGLDASIFVSRALDGLAITEHSFAISMHPCRIKPPEGRIEPYRASCGTYCTLKIKYSPAYGVSYVGTVVQGGETKYL